MENDMPAPRGAEVWRDYVTDGVPSSGKNQPAKADARAWSTWLENLVTSGVLSSGPWFATKEAMTLGYAANTIAVVYDDTTAAENGLYIKVGASGSGSWSQLTTFLPGYQFVTASPTGASTANAIVASTSPRLPAGDGVALVTLAIPATNTASPVTVRFDGGAVLTVKTRSGEDPAIGELQAGDIVSGFVSGSTFRLIVDPNSLIHMQGAREWANNAENVPVSAAAGGDGATTFSAKHWAAKSEEDADRSDDEADRSEVARVGAESARDQAAGYVNDIVSEKEVPITATRNGMESIEFPAGMISVETRGFGAVGDGGGAQYGRVSSEPDVPTAAKVRSLDRWTAEGNSDSANGGWWVLDEVEAKFTQFGAFPGASATVNRDALRAGVSWAHKRYNELGWQVPVSLPSGDYDVGGGDLDATTDWRHICIVQDGVIVRGPGRLVTNTPLAARAVLFVVRGDDVAFDGVSFYDEYSSGSNFIVPIGMGTAYDSGMESNRTYRGLEVKNCTVQNAWLSASVQMVATDDGTTFIDGVIFRDSRSFANPSATSAGNFNARSDPPGKIKNVSMYNNVAKDGKTASSYNLVGVYGFRVVNNESHRNLYAGCELENGCERGIVLALTSHDDNIGLWIDDSRHIVWRGIAMHTTTETLVTPLLGTSYRSRPAVRISHQGFTAEPDYVTTGIVGGDVVGEFNRIEVGLFGSPLGASRIDTVVIDGYVFNGDGVARTAGNRGIFASNVSDLTICNARVIGALSTAIDIGVPAGGVARIRNTVTQKVGAESTSGLTTSGAGRLVIDDCDFHSVSLGHTGGTEATKYRVAGVKQPNQDYTNQITIADDAVVAIDLPLNKNGGVIFVEKVGSSTAYGWARTVWSGAFASAAVAGTNGANFAVNTSAGTLSGTTGADGNLTVRVNTDGKLYVENRTGSSSTIRVVWES